MCTCMPGLGWCWRQNFAFLKYLKYLLCLLPPTCCSWQGLLIYKWIKDKSQRLLWYSVNLLYKIRIKVNGKWKTFFWWATWKSGWVFLSLCLLPCEIHLQVHTPSFFSTWREVPLPVFWSMQRRTWLCLIKPLMNMTTYTVHLKTHVNLFHLKKEKTFTKLSCSSATCPSFLSFLALHCLFSSCSLLS